MPEGWNAPVAAACWGVIPSRSGPTPAGERLRLAGWVVLVVRRATPLVGTTGLDGPGPATVAVVGAVTVSVGGVVDASVDGSTGREVVPDPETH